MVTGTRGQDLVLGLDGLPALEVAAHAKEKEFVIDRISDIFNAGMQYKWSQRYYVDLFCGPGLCSLKDGSGEIDGSPMLAAKSKAKFTHYYFADENGDNLSALEQRISRLHLPRTEDIHFYRGEADNLVDRIVDALPPPQCSLGLAVFDPWGWDFSFSTLADITDGLRLDLVVNFPIGYMKRNWEKDLPRLDAYMNGDTYRGPFRAAMRRENPGETPARVLLDAYAKELQKIGYSYIRDNVFVENSRGVTLYGLLFASKHSRGADFWDKVTKRTDSGQIRMFS